MGLPLWPNISPIAHPVPRSHDGLPRSNTPIPQSYDGLPSPAMSERNEGGFESGRETAPALATPEVFHHGYYSQMQHIEDNRDYDAESEDNEEMLEHEHGENAEMPEENAYTYRPARELEDLYIDYGSRNNFPSERQSVEPAPANILGNCNCEECVERREASREVVAPGHALSQTGLHPSQLEYTQADEWDDGYGGMNAGGRSPFERMMPGVNYQLTRALDRFAELNADFDNLERLHRARRRMALETHLRETILNITGTSEQHRRD